MALSRRTLEEFVSLRERLVAVLNGVTGIFRELDEPERSRDLERATHALLGDRFQVVVMGEMKHGKSTLVNAFLGGEIIPSQFGEPCTAIPISVRWGERWRALCYRRTAEPPEEIDPVRDPALFREAVTIPAPLRRPGPGDPETAQKLHPFTHAELEGPLPFVQQGVELVDSPGLNEDPERTERTWDQVQDSGAVILMFTCQQLGKQSELSDFREIRAKGRDPRVIFVVWNYFDLCPSDAASVARVKAAGRGIAAEAGIPEDHVHFLSASRALEASRTGESAALEASGLPALSAALGEFLVNERMSAKLLTPLGIAERAVAEAIQDVLTRRTVLWNGSLQRTGEAARLGQEGVQRAHDITGQLRSKVRKTAQGLSRDVSSAVRDLIDELCAGVEGAVRRVSVSSMDAIFQTEFAKRGLMDKIQEWVQQQTTAWEQARLAPLLREASGELREAANGAFAELADVRTNLIELRARVRSERDRSLAVAAAESGVQEAAERLRGGADTAGWIDGNMLADLSALSGIGIGALFATLFGSWWVYAILAAPFLPLIVALAVIGGAIGGMTAGGILKTRTAATVKEGMRKNAAELEGRVLDAVQRSVRGAVEVVEGKLNAVRDEIQALSDSIDSGHTENERRVTDLLKRASGQRSQLQGFADELDSLRSEVDRARRVERWAAQSVEPFVSGASDEDRAARAGPGAGGPGRPSLSRAEMEARLDPGAMKSLGKVEECLRYYNRWNDQTQQEIMAAWCRLPRLSDQAIAQVPVFRTVAAMAVSCGTPGLPEPKEVREWWDDGLLREMLLDVYEAVAEDKHEYERAILPDHRERQRGLFVLAYSRALKTTLAAEAPAEGSRRG